MTQLNVKLELVIVTVVCLYASTLSLSLTTWLLLSIALSVVLIAELFNTAIEVTCDLISLKYDINIKIIKDVAAGAVLIAAFSAFCIIIIILLTSKNGGI
ncbi:MAG: diacylglycerol kinase [Saprospiraceae bacterium]|nr:diacylglycerol kinase [Bacteroidia bacterium]NNE13536.1 diacylglycerol kinase [Saprospiraceae bacterium]NNL92531.1 diacylglycerol kinase [Saprospiraceae bacterium]